MTRIRTKPFHREGRKGRKGKRGLPQINADDADQKTKSRKNKKPKAKKTHHWLGCCNRRVSPFAPAALDWRLTFVNPVIVI
jgi:hypothetical protein